MDILIAKIVHIFGIVAWFSGLFYLVRMFVYHTEAYDEVEPKRSILLEQFHIMENRVYTIICTPALIIVWLSGIFMIWSYGLEWFKNSGWLHIKLLFVIGLTVYHFYCKKIISQLLVGKTKFSSTGFRLFNEVPTLVLVIAPALAILKSLVNYGYLFLSIFVLIIVLILLTKLYKSIRDKKQN